MRWLLGLEIDSTVTLADFPALAGLKELLPLLIQRFVGSGTPQAFRLPVISLQQSKTRDGFRTKMEWRD